MNNKYQRLKAHRLKRIPPPPKKCNGQLYTVKPNESIFSIARNFGLTVNDILAANPQISNSNKIFANQVICIPKRASEPKPDCDLNVFSLNFLTLEGQPLPEVDGAIQLNTNVIVRPTFNRPVSRVFFFLEPTGTETCELASLIGVDCPSAVTGVAEIIWEVPPGTLGRVFVVACINNCCAKSDEVLVVRD